MNIKNYLYSIFSYNEKHKYEFLFTKIEFVFKMLKEFPLAVLKFLLIFGYLNFSFFSVYIFIESLTPLFSKW